MLINIHHRFLLTSYCQIVCLWATPFVSHCIGLRLLRRVGCILCSSTRGVQILASEVQLTQQLFDLPSGASHQRLFFFENALHSAGKDVAVFRVQLSVFKCRLHYFRLERHFQLVGVTRFSSFGDRVVKGCRQRYSCVEHLNAAHSYTFRHDALF